MLTTEIGGFEAAREALARERLEELQALARTYRNWTVKELAHALGRQPGRLVPESGMPKIDLVVGLAKALDWPVEAVVDHLMKPPAGPRKVVHPKDTAADYARLYNESAAKRLERDYFEAIRLAVRAGVVADTGNRRAGALVLESEAHESTGSYVEAVRCLREAIRMEGIAIEWRIYCDSKLGNLLFMQGLTTQSLGIASSVLEYAQNLPSSLLVRTSQMLGHWTRGHVLRSAVPLLHTESWRSLAASAREDFCKVKSLCMALVVETDGNPLYFGSFSGVIDPMLLELDAICDEEQAEFAVQALLAILREGGSADSGIGERKAWAAVAVANTVRRVVPDEMQRRGILDVASAALRAHAVATSNWYFAHKHLELDAERRRNLVGHGTASRALDALEAKLVAGVLGQVPAAREHAAEFFALYGSGEGVRA